MSNNDVDEGSWWLSIHFLVSSLKGLQLASFGDFIEGIAMFENPRTVPR